MIVVASMRSFGNSQTSEERDFLEFGVATYPLMKLEGIHWLPKENRD
jgi:hypothetical protein